MMTIRPYINCFILWKMLTQPFLFLKRKGHELVAAYLSSTGTVLYLLHYVVSYDTTTKVNGVGHPLVNGVSQNLTASIGGSALFHGRPLKDVCVWVFLGADQTKLEGKDVLYADDTSEKDLVYRPYEDRIEKHSNCTFRLKNIKPPDEGWYRMTRDLGQKPEDISFHYLHVIGNQRSHVAAVCSLLLVLVLIGGFILLLKCQKSKDILQTVGQSGPGIENTNGVISNGVLHPVPQLDPIQSHHIVEPFDR